jgi:ketosteroid isomerase-like protein
MAADDMEIADRFRAALESAVESGDLQTVYPLLAPDIEWVTPQRMLHGIDEVRSQLNWISTPENFVLEFTLGDWLDQGDGRLACDVHEVYRLKDTGDFGYERDRRIELTIRSGQIARYEMRITG